MVLAFVLWSNGYAKGMHDYAADPEGMRRDQCTTLLKSIQAIDKDGKVPFCDQKSPEVKMVARVFPRILRGARDEVKALELKLAEEIKAVKDKGQNVPNDLKDHKERLQRAKAQLQNWSDDGYIVLDQNIPNAFVHATIPRLVFIQRGLFRLNRTKPFDPNPAPGVAVAVRNDTLPDEVKAIGQDFTEGVLLRQVAENDTTRYCVKVGGAECLVAADKLRLLEKHTVIKTEEQLAMLLSHELSHVIHDHAVDTARMMGIMAGVQLVFLAILDPTGLLTFVAEMGMPALAKYGFQLPESRAHETEADSTGLRICARAGYNPHDATTFFEQMMAMEDAAGKRGKGEWASTHPKTANRIEALHQAEKDALALYKSKA